MIFREPSCPLSIVGPGRLPDSMESDLLDLGGGMRGGPNLGGCGRRRWGRNLSQRGPKRS